MDSGSLQKIVYLCGILAAAVGILLLATKLLTTNIGAGREYKERAHLSEVALDEIQHRGGKR